VFQEEGVRARKSCIAFKILPGGNDREGRRRIRAIGDAIPKAKEGDVSAIQTISENLDAYIQLLRNHIEKEDNVLYPTADKVFTEQDQQSLSEAFDKVEAEEMGEGVHEKYHKLAHDLSNF
jgi:hemerythrin-like domain-containing protein